MAGWIRHTARRLGRSPVFSLTALLTLTVGLGCATTVFSVVNAVLLRPLPYPQSERLVSVSHSLQVGGDLRVGQTDASILFYRRHNRAFSQFGGYQAGAAALGPAGGADAERVGAGRVTVGVLDALRVLPLRGRLFTGPDDEPGSAPVVILSERLWARRFGADPGVLHRRITVDGEPHEVVGILPDTVRFPASDTELWLPLGLNPAKTDSASFDYEAVGRLRDGVSVQQAEADLQGLLPRLPDEFPGRLTRGAIEATHMRASVRPLASVVVEGVAALLWVVFGAAGFVLAAACANVACLFLVRAEGRRKTFAIQHLLGAPARTVLLEFLGEAFLVAGVGGAAGVGVAAAAARVLRSASAAIDIPRLTEVRVDGVVLGVAALATAVTTVAIGAFTAWRSSTAGSGGLASLSPASTTGRAQHRARYALVALQVGLAMVLVVGSGLIGRSLWHLRRVHPGFERTGALTFRLAVPPSAYPGTDDAVRFFARAMDAVSEIPGVQSAGAASKLPLEERDQTSTAVFVESRPLPPGVLPRIHPVAYVAAGYFKAMGIPLVEGETFGPLDPPNVRLETIVSRAFAARYWPGESPVGKRIRILPKGPWYTVVGVAGDVRDAALDKPADEMIYCPLLPARADLRWAPRDLAFVVRTSGDPAAAAGAVRAAIRRLDSSLPLYHAQKLSDLVAQSSARRELVLLLVSVASGIALLLGAIGLYGVMAYVVSLRTREIGIRIALGERAARVGWLVARQGVAVAIPGVAIGLAGAIALARFLGALLFQVAPSDPLVFAASAVLVLAIAAAASWIPSRRAAMVDPVLALKAE
ncbi:MAG: ABC transporter permease [Betaproteobacteria bacterium]